jgi:very-short-patch-repair endonuclease
MKKRLRSFPASIQNARKFRKQPTTAERVQWTALRGRRLGGWKFRRQHPMEQFVLDFFCRGKHMAIEIDGAVHDDADTAEHDAERAAFLSRHGVTLLRFRNEQVMNDLSGVLEMIRKEMEILPHP